MASPWLSAAILGTMLAMAFALPTADQSWENFKAKYQKTYKDSDDEASRHSLFTIAKYPVAQLNLLNGQSAFGVNWMSDRFPHEQHKKGLNKPKDFKPSAPVLEFKSPRSPSSVDWRLTDAITSINNQG